MEESFTEEFFTLNDLVAVNVKTSQYKPKEKPIIIGYNLTITEMTVVGGDEVKLSLEGKNDLKTEVQKKIHPSLQDWKTYFNKGNLLDIGAAMVDSPVLVKFYGKEIEKLRQILYAKQTPPTRDTLSRQLLTITNQWFKDCQNLADRYPNLDTIRQTSVQNLVMLKTKQNENEA
jgi:hypothetical protein|eukprot:COSAG01_NODE_1716_length_9403_cov_4.038697_10_plen_174_part_00